MIGEDLALQELNSNIMKEKEIKIEVPQGYDIDRERSTFDIIRLKKKEVEFEHFKFKGAWIDEYSRVHSLSDYSSNGILLHDEYRKIWISPAHAKTSLAMSELSIRMASPTYNGDWVADYTDGTRKYNITFYNDNILTGTTIGGTHAFLSFKTADARDKFLENHRDLILEAKLLL